MQLLYFIRFSLLRRSHFVELKVLRAPLFVQEICQTRDDDNGDEGEGDELKAEKSQKV